jgi:hypothetical protein
LEVGRWLDTRIIFEIFNPKLGKSPLLFALGEATEDLAEWFLFGVTQR